MNFFLSNFYSSNSQVGIPTVFDLISNAAYKTFKIVNNIAEETPIKAVNIWSPFSQLHEDDGTDDDEPSPPHITNFQ